MSASSHHQSSLTAHPLQCERTTRDYSDVTDCLTNQEETLKTVYNEQDTRYGTEGLLKPSFPKTPSVYRHRVRDWRPPEFVLVNGALELVDEFRDFGLAIHQNDHQARRRFVEWAQNETVVVPDFHKRILLSDEAHFWLNGYVNKQNCRIWSEANPQVYVETPLHPEKLTVWCALWAGGIIGPYFFKNDEGHNVTVNGDRYRAMITNFFIPELNNHDVQELWFQQDGATCHIARATIDLLKDTFGDRLISRFGPMNWPPRSCDLTPLDYFI
ncbi:putative DD41D transposase [Trichonephila clavipes]|nr:putative DD41D transposase [Trichonephila clavipes]